MGLQHSFNSFGKWCSFPQELFNVKKTGNAGHAFDDQRETTTYFYLTEERRRTYTSPTSMLLVILFYKVPAVFNIFVVKYNPVSQSTTATVIPLHYSLKYAQSIGLAMNIQSWQLWFSFHFFARAPWSLFHIYLLTPVASSWMKSPKAEITFFSFCPSPLNENFCLVFSRFPVLGYRCTLKSPEAPTWLKSSASEQETISWLPVTSPSAKLASPSTTATSVTPESSAPAATASGEREMVQVAVRGATSMAAFMSRASSQTATTAEKGAPSALRMSRSVNLTESAH